MDGWTELKGGIRTDLELQWLGWAGLADWVGATSIPIWDGPFSSLFLQTSGPRTKMEGSWNAVEACGRWCPLRQSRLLARATERASDCPSPFPVIFLAGLLLADLSRAEGEKGKSGCGWSFSRFLSFPVACRYRGLCAGDGLVSLLCSACPSLPPPFPPAHSIEYLTSQVYHPCRIAGLPVPGQPGTSLAHLVRRVPVLASAASTVRLWLFLHLLLFLCFVLYCAVFQWIVSSYRCIALYIHCTACSVLRAFCILPGLHQRACPSPRPRPRLANRTGWLGITPAITRCCVHLYVIATGIHPAPSAQPRSRDRTGHPTCKPTRYGAYLCLPPDCRLHGVTPAGLTASKDLDAPTSCPLYCSLLGFSYLVCCAALHSVTIVLDLDSSLLALSPLVDSDLH